MNVDDYSNYIENNIGNLNQDQQAKLYRRFKSQLDQFKASYEAEPIGTYIYLNRITSPEVMYEMYIFVRTCISSGTAPDIRLT